MNKRTMLLVAGVAAAFAAEAAPVVSAEGTPVAYGGSKLRFDYKLTEEPAVITVDIQTNAGENAWASIGGEHQWHMLGDVNRRVAPDANVTRSIYWNGELDWPGHVVEAGKTRAVIEAWPTNALPPYMTMEILYQNNVQFYRDRASIPGGITNRRYKTSHVLFRKIPAKGVRWQMGDGQKATEGGGVNTKHYVTLTEDYYMAVFEFTHAQYADVANISGSFAGPKNLVAKEKNTCVGEVALCPVAFLTEADLRGAQDTYDWKQSNPSHDLDPKKALGFLRTMTIDVGFQFDLPTEAQWEYACRAGTSTLFNVGDNLNGQGWTSECAEGKKHEVGLLQPNAWDLYDMHGNVAEMCLDYYATSIPADEVTDPPGPETSVNRVVRGGCLSWTAVTFGTSSGRYRINLTDNSRSFFGFRPCAPAVIK